MGDERHECPEAFCIAEFREQELAAHLEMDHGYSEYKAEKRAGEAVA